MIDGTRLLISLLMKRTLTGLSRTLKTLKEWSKKRYKNQILYFLIFQFEDIEGDCTCPVHLAKVYGGDLDVDIYEKIGNEDEGVFDIKTGKQQAFTNKTVAPSGSEFLAKNPNSGVNRDNISDVLAEKTTYNT